MIKFDEKENAAINLPSGAATPVFVPFNSESAYHGPYNVDFHMGGFFVTNKGVLGFHRLIL